MKSYRQFVNENYNVPVVDIETTGTDLTIPEIKAELNRNIDLVLHQKFKTVDEAVAKFRKILALYNLDLPQLEQHYDKSGSFESSVGKHNIVWDEFSGKMDDYITYKVKFSYNLVDGLYKCSAELL